MDETMGTRIRTLREAKGLTQQQLADELGVTKGAVSAWETGYAENIRLQTFLKLLDVLGVKKPEYLIWGADRDRSGLDTGGNNRKKPPPKS
jgi:transcriptional regulator with XRE-family HTH domain